MSFHEVLIPVLAMIIPIIVLFVVRGLDIGRKQTRQEVNVEVITEQISTIRTHVGDLFTKNAQISKDLAVLTERLKNHMEMTR